MFPGRDAAEADGARQAVNTDPGQPTGVAPGNHRGDGPGGGGVQGRKRGSQTASLEKRARPVAMRGPLAAGEEANAFGDQDRISDRASGQDAGFGSVAVRVAPAPPV